jgi:hypothetical protein
MAALKKTTKKKDAGKPGTVLIIFLVFFILLSIGLGVFAYYGYEGQNKLREETANAKKRESVLKNVDEYRMGIIQMLGTALGQDVDVDYKVHATNALEEIVKENSKYAADATLKDRVAYVKLFQEMRSELSFDDNEKKFKDNYRARFKQSQDDLKKTETQLAVTRKELQATKDQFTSYQNKLDAYWKDALGQISKGNAASLAAAMAKFESTNTLLKQNQEIQDQKIEADAKIKALEEKLSIEVALRHKILEEKKNTHLEVIQTPKKNGGEQHALILDLSRGIPLWDRPVGKVTRIDLDKRQVYINLGSSHGVQPELTFNIFADDGKGRPDKFLKGTIEVIRVIDSQMSLCRLTSLYDAGGNEIALNDPTKGRAAREVESALQQGDLLFNMFWHTHVAIAGPVNFTGFPIHAPAEQMRQLASFTQLLERMGIRVDAYLDPADVQVKGAISNKTRFLILGEYARPSNPNDQGQADRAKQINEAISAMKKEAIEKGLFLISAENFAVASGYRRPRNANDSETTGFRSAVPYAGSAAGGLVIQRDRPIDAPMPMPEKKAPQPNEMK